MAGQRTIRNELLETGELAEITVDLSGSVDPTRHQHDLRPGDETTQRRHLESATHHAGLAESGQRPKVGELLGSIDSAHKHEHRERFVQKQYADESLVSLKSSIQ